METTPPEHAQTYLQLRSRVLNLDPAELDLLPSTTAPQVWGVIMEIGYTVGIATLVSLSDGTTSLYYSTGGGMLGSGEYTPVSEASKAVVIQAQNHLQDLSLADEFPLPEAGRVRFTFLTYSGIFTAEVPEKTLASGKHQLSSLFALGHETLTQLRLLAEKKRK